ncbi:MAG: helix-turn-helix domain-containing protein [Kiritimatiellales bacterium]
MKSSVPGLSRGIQVWKVLCEQGDASLDQITQRTGFPKASVLRMLQTLCDLQLIARDEKTGAYRATARIVFAAGAAPEFELRVQQALEKLSAELQVTAEWYEPGADGLLLVRRASPPDAEVRVKARAGFLRRWNDELDAVAVLGYAFYNAAPKSRRGLWQYGSRGERVKIPAADAKEIISAAKRSGAAADENFNANGVKRTAAAVIRAGNLSGVLSLAMPFMPALDSEIPARTNAVRTAADELES